MTCKAAPTTSRSFSPSFSSFRSSGLSSSGTTYSLSTGLLGGGRGTSLVFERSVGATCALGTVLGAGELMLGASDTSVNAHINTVRRCELTTEPEAIHDNGVTLTNVSVVGLRQHVGTKTVLRLFKEVFKYILQGGDRHLQRRHMKESRGRLFKDGVDYFYLLPTIFISYIYLFSEYMNAALFQTWKDLNSYNYEYVRQHFDFLSLGLTGVSSSMTKPDLKVVTL